MAASARPAREALADRARRAGAHRDAEDDSTRRCRCSTARAFKGVERRAKRFLLPTDDEELVVMVHLMSAGRLKYVAAEREGRQDAHVPRALRGRR